MDIAALRSQWSEVLDHLEGENRIAWMAFFDARLAQFEDGTLFLDYSDSRKFSGNLEYGQIRDSHRNALAHSIQVITGARIMIVDQE